MDFAGKVAVVTGASRGIGRAIALRLAAGGARVVVNYRGNQAAADEVVGQIQASSGQFSGSGTPQAIAIQADVSQPAQAQALIDAAVKAFGRLDILVNNAAVEVREPFLEARPENWDLTFAVNLRGTYFLSQAAAKAMIRTGGGNILNIASIHDTVAIRNASIYSITKGGTGMLTKSLALELAEHKINVNAISPGAILTDLNRNVLEDSGYRAKVLAKIPWGRIGDVDDLVGAAVFLVSREADYITGATLYVDGGMLLR
jgi:glucose 1-dehydrogenase